MIGANTAGAMPLIIPLYAPGATPMIVYWRPDEPHRASDDGRIAGERALPVVVRENDDRVRAGRDVVLGAKQPADLRSKAEQREVIAVHQLAGERLDVIAGVERGDGELRDRDLGERACRGAAEVDVVRVRERREREIALSLIDLGDLLGMRDRRASEQDRVHEAEHRRVGADAERQRKQRDEGEAGTLSRAADGKADVAGECVRRRSP